MSQSESLLNPSPELVSQGARTVRSRAIAARGRALGYGVTGYDECGEGNSKRKGCFLNVSYVVSAPLHYEGFHDFWGGADWIGRMTTLFDFLIHVGLWVAVLIIDCLIYTNDEVGLPGTSMFMREIQNGVLVSTVLVWIGLLLALILGALGQPAGKAFPSTIGLVLGGGFSSMMFSLVYLVLLPDGGPTGIMTATDGLVTLRQLSVWTLGLKTLAFYVAKANIDFHGACEHESMLKNICAFMKSKPATDLKVVRA